MSLVNTSTGFERRARRSAAFGRAIIGGVVAATSTGVVAALYALSIRAAGVPMTAGFLGARAAGSISVASFPMGAVVCIFWATLIALVLIQKAVNPPRSFARTTIVLVAVSLVVPLGAAHTSVATKIALVGAHLLVAAIAIPIMTHILRIGMSANRCVE